MAFSLRKRPIILSERSSRVHPCCRNESELDGCLSEWGYLGFGVTGSVCDVSVRAQREELMSTVSTLFDGKLNILINNVGRNIRKPVVDFTAAEFSTLMATNFESVFHISQLAYPPLKASGVGSIGATKGAIYQLAKTLACERAKDNIRSNAVAPRYIRTSMVEQVTPDCYVTINRVEHHVGKGRCLNFSMEVIPHTPTAIH
ncbi:tropinone reductase homolog At2g29260, chloroplastic-like [Castanea sativa]|uniref:tropinone reductase homolog At2g29260, chloroplastic-like n=1 Tax=Castanea sativa TaxID=21020 RepID=UPI003F64B5DF